MNLRLNFLEAIESGDVARAALVWPKLSVENGFDLTLDDYVSAAIELDSADSLQWLIDSGADVNGLKDSLDCGHVSHAITEESWQCVNVLLNRNAQINFGNESEPKRCYALEDACEQGLIDLVKRLVEYGAWVDYDVPVRRAAGNPEITEYLKSVGATASAPSQKTSQPKDWLVEHISRYIGVPQSQEIHQVLADDDIPVSVLVVPTDGALVLVTRGMSDTVVPNEEGHNTAGELLIRLPSNWKVDLAKLSPEIVWAVGCLQAIANIPSKAGIAFPFSVSTPKGCVPPLDCGKSKFTNLLVISAMKELPAALNGDQHVSFHYLLPIFEEEAELEQQIGIIELLTRFESQGIGRRFDPYRPNVGKLN